jgi:crotonobetainyl-CoA:carnitine CoA-transferase CaiB-like acyl-CoA transferase
MSGRATSPPLQGVTILEAGGGVPAGYCGRLLRSLGATVVKLELRDDLDWVREYGAACSAHPGIAASYCHLNGSKLRVVAPPAGDPGTLALFRGLIARADMTVAGEGALADLLDEALADPSLQQSSYLRFAGSTLPLDGRALNADEAAGSAAGLRDLYGRDHPPEGLRTDVAEIGAACHGAATVAMALARGALGDSTPVRIELGMFESSFSMIEIAAQLILLGEHFNGTAPDPVSSVLQSPLICRDGLPVVITLVGWDAWNQFATAMDRPDLLDDRRFVEPAVRYSHGPELRDIQERWCARHDRATIMQRLREVNLPFAPVSSLAELTQEAQIVQSGLIEPDPDDAHRSVASCYRLDGDRMPLPFVAGGSCLDGIRAFLPSTGCRYAEDLHAVCVDVP